MHLGLGIRFRILSESLKDKNSLKLCDSASCSLRRVLTRLNVFNILKKNKLTQRRQDAKVLILCICPHWRMYPWIRKINELIWQFGKEACQMPTLTVQMNQEITYNTYLMDRRHFLALVLKLYSNQNKLLFYLQVYV